MQCISVNRKTTSILVYFINQVMILILPLESGVGEVYFG